MIENAYHSGNVMETVFSVSTGGVCAASKWKL